jgi:hypothetical protein
VGRGHAAHRVEDDVVNGIDQFLHLSGIPREHAKRQSYGAAAG